MRLNEAGRNFLKEAHSESACAPGRCIVLGERETREQGRGIGMTDLLVLVGRQAAVGVQLGGERRRNTGGGGHGGAGQTEKVPGGGCPGGPRRRLRVERSVSLERLSVA